MEFELNMGGASQFELKGAILVYSSGHLANGAFASWHETIRRADQAPILSQAQALSSAFLRELARGLGATTRAEVLTDNVLVRTPETLMWWTPARRCPMFFRSGDALEAVSGRAFPQPALVFKVSRRELWIRALSKSARPDGKACLMVAPYYNVNGEGLVCQGSMRAPDQPSVAAMRQWEQAFFESQFTHIYGGGRLTRHADGVAGLWTSLADKRVFPVTQLVPARETLAQFAEREH